MNITNNSPETITFTKQGEFNYTADYGNRPIGFDSNFNITLESEYPLKDFKVSAGCPGCTTAKDKKINDKQYVVSVHYKKTQQESMINKSVNVMYDQNGERKKLIIKLLGTISAK